MPSPEPTRITRVGGRPITAWDFGAAADEPVVLAVHDLTANGLWFGDLADAGAGRFRLVAPDLRGRAASVAAPPPDTIDDLVADLCGLVDRVGVTTFSIVGHGTGATLALAVATTVPDRVDGVVALDGPPVPTGTRDADWTVAAARVDPGIGRLGRTWVHRDAAVVDARASGRVPQAGMTRALRRAIDAETTGSGFGWRPRLANATLAREWALTAAWTPPVAFAAPVTVLQATHGHRVDEPPIERRDLGVPAHPVDTTHTGLLVDASALRTVTMSLDASSALGSNGR